MDCVGSGGEGSLVTIFFVTLWIDMRKAHGGGSKRDCVFGSNHLF